MQNRREVNQDGLRPFALCAVNCKKGSEPTFAALQAQNPRPPLTLRRFRPKAAFQRQIRLPRCGPSKRTPAARAELAHSNRMAGAYKTE